VDRNLGISISHGVIDLISPRWGLFSNYSLFCYQKIAPMGQKTLQTIKWPIYATENINPETLFLNRELATSIHLFYQINCNGSLQKGKQLIFSGNLKSRAISCFSLYKYAIVFQICTKLS
jgi:hypothetical protein